jgi:hypothetical protein
MNRIMKRMALPVGAAIVLGSSGFAFMASNAFTNDIGAGEGVNNVAGYVTNGGNTQLCRDNNNGAAVGVNGKTCRVDLIAKPLGSNPVAREAQAQPVNKAGNALGPWVQCVYGASDQAQGAAFTCDFVDFNGNSGIDTEAYKGFKISIAG